MLGRRHTRRQAARSVGGATGPGSQSALPPDAPGSRREPENGGADQAGAACATSAPADPIPSQEGE